MSRRGTNFFPVIFYVDVALCVVFTCPLGQRRATGTLGPGRSVCAWAVVCRDTMARPTGKQCTPSAVTFKKCIYKPVATVYIETGFDHRRGAMKLTRNANKAIRLFCLRMFYLRGPRSIPTADSNWHSVQFQGKLIPPQML